MTVCLTRYGPTAMIDTGEMPVFVRALYLATDPLRFFFFTKLYHDDTVNLLSVYFQDKRKMNVRQFIVKKFNCRQNKYSSQSSISTYCSL